MPPPAPPRVDLGGGGGTPTRRGEELGEAGGRQSAWKNLSERFFLSLIPSEG